MKKKQWIAAVVATIACMAMSLTPALAASVDQGNAADGLGTEFTFELKNDPTYTVTIPSAVTLTKEGTQVDIVAENVATLDIRKAFLPLSERINNGNRRVLEERTRTGSILLLAFKFV